MADRTQTAQFVDRIRQRLEGTWDGSRNTKANTWTYRGRQDLVQLVLGHRKLVNWFRLPVLPVYQWREVTTTPVGGGGGGGGRGEGKQRTLTTC